MQFKHPELLYALFLLLIPILVHLFQLRKFKKVAFTNVAFLQKIQLHTRKSSTIKRWLILCLRMAALAMLVLAFAQPFLSGSDSATKEKETVVYLDNSFSMQAKGSNGPLLKQALQEIIASIPENQEFTLLTNDEVFQNITVKGERNTLLKIPYAPEQLSEQAIMLKAKTSFSSRPTTEKRLILISDFQEKGEKNIDNSSDVSLYKVQLQPVNSNNIRVDSLYISEVKTQTIGLTAIIGSQVVQETNIPVSLFDGERLLAKATASLDESNQTKVIFEIASDEAIEGRIQIDQPHLGFDNSLYFTINKAAPIKVLSINESDDSFLRRVYTTPEFLYGGVPTASLDYSDLNSNNLIVLNQLGTIPPALSNALRTFVNSGGSILFIPSPDKEISAYTSFLQATSTMQFEREITKSKLVTSINYDHPLYNGVFQNRIKNFQYPSVTKSYILNGGDAVLQYEDGSTFLGMVGKTYVFTASLDASNSNFKNSPLIVPTLYNIGKQSLELASLYYQVSKEEVFDIPIALPEDAILSIENTATGNSFIPLQKSFGTRVSITTQELPKTAGSYNITYKDSILQQVSYNYNRDESNLIYQKPTAQEGIIYSSIPDLFEGLDAADDIQLLWKWFVIFALLFLILEMLILKFLK